MTTHHSPSLRNPMGTAGFVLALIGAVLAFIPLLGIFAGFVLGPLGLILAGVGLMTSFRRHGVGRGLSIAGIALGIAAMVIAGVNIAGTNAAVNAINTRPPPAPSPTMQTLAPDRPTSTHDTSSAAPTASGIGDGTYVVGSDIKAGTYKTTGPSDSVFPLCYWSRLKDTSGDLNGIIANGDSQGPTTVTIKSSDGAFQTSGCAAWVKVK